MVIFIHIQKKATPKAASFFLAALMYVSNSVSCSESDAFEGVFWYFVSLPPDFEKLDSFEIIHCSTVKQGGVIFG